MSGPGPSAGELSHENAGGADSLNLDVHVPAALDGQRVDRTVSLLGGVSRRAAAEAVENGTVTLDGRPLRVRSTPLRVGQHLRATLPAKRGADPRPDATVGFAVVHADDDLVVVDKPAGLVVHHGAGQRGATLVDGLLARFPDLARLVEAGVGDGDRPGIVHRLDKGTSGLLVVARSPAAFASISAQLRRHEVDRRYLALVAGIVAADRGEIEAPIGRSARRPERMTVRAGGRPARTRYQVRARFDHPVPLSFVEATLETGRTHQVRVHFDAIGHPVIGDDRYGGPGARPPSLIAMLGSRRLFLHAWRLGLEYPEGNPRRWEAPLPADLADVLAMLEQRHPEAGDGGGAVIG
jgi:23S rRNA pseudouridine1911/1915/1917 synthase